MEMIDCNLTWSIAMILNGMFIRFLDLLNPFRCIATIFKSLGDVIVVYDLFELLIGDVIAVSGKVNGLDATKLELVLLIEVVVIFTFRFGVVLVELHTLNEVDKVALVLLGIDFDLDVVGSLTSALARNCYWSIQ